MNDASSGFNVGFVYLLFDFCVCVRVAHRNMSRSSSKRSKGDLFPGTVQPPRCKGIHVYLFCTQEGGTYLSHTSGDVTAEELCFLAAKAVGETDEPIPTCVGTYVELLCY